MMKFSVSAAVIFILFHIIPLYAFAKEYKGYETWWGFGPGGDRIFLPTGVANLEIFCYGGRPVFQISDFPGSKEVFYGVTRIYYEFWLDGESGYTDLFFSRASGNIREGTIVFGWPRSESLDRLFQIIENASQINIYLPEQNQEYSERDPKGGDLLSLTTVGYEKAAADRLRDLCNQG